MYFYGSKQAKHIKSLSYEIEEFLYLDHLLQIFAHPHYAFLHYERKLLNSHEECHFSVSPQRSNLIEKPAAKNIPKMAAYVGKYDRTSADKYDEFLSEFLREQRSLMERQIMMPHFLFYSKFSRVIQIPKNQEVLKVQS